ncbi:MAG: PEP-utilizing enzyme, partial [bacterium]
ITSPEEVWSFELPPTEPNFITTKSASGPRTTVSDTHDSLSGGILMIPSADPGFDWIFSHGIAGFITKYGGANSHMAIRAVELGIPAVIGAGDSLFSLWSRANSLRVDCANRQVQILK